MVKTLLSIFIAVGLLAAAAVFALMRRAAEYRRKAVFAMEKRIIAVNSNCYHGYPVEDALEGIAAAGFHYVELTATKGWTEHVFPDQSFEKLCAVKDKMKELASSPSP